MRAQTSANSITPEGLGSILQKITDLIGALSQIPEQEATDILSRLNQCESDCETARQAAQQAQSQAAANVIDGLTVDQTASDVTVTVTQHGGNSVSDTIPAATTTFAGLLSATDKYHLDVAYNKRLKQLTTSSYEDRVVMNYKRGDDTLTQLTFGGASTLEAGLMTAADKVALNAATQNITLLQAWQTTVNNTLERCARLDADTYKLNPGDMPPVLIYGMGEPGEGSCPIGGAYWDPETKLFWLRIQVRLFKPIEPNINLEYRNIYSGKCYYWDAQEETMVPISDQPAVINDCVTGGALVALSAQQGVLLHGETQLNEARYRNLRQMILTAQSLSTLQSALNAAGADTYYPLTLNLTNCTLQESVPAYLGPVDSGVNVKVKANTGYEVGVNSVTIYDGQGVAQENDITHDIYNDGWIQYNATTGVLTVTLEDPGRYDIYIQATPTS